MRLDLLSPPTAHRYRLDHLSLIDEVWSGRVDGHVVRLPGGPVGDLRDVFARNRLDSVITSAGNAENRKPPQEPGDVVDQYVALPEDQRRPDDRVRQTGLSHSALRSRLARVIVERRILCGIPHRTVDYIHNSSVSCC